MKIKKGFRAFVSARASTGVRAVMVFRIENVQSPHTPAAPDEETLALQETDVGPRVKVCVVDEPHLRVPAVPGIRDALVDPVRWDNGACSWGGGAPGSEREPRTAARAPRRQPGRG